MRPNYKNSVATIVLSLCLCSIAQLAAAQTTQATTQVETVGTPPPTATAVSTPTVPRYQPTEYELTPPGSSATGSRSETKHWPNRPLMGTSAFVLTAAYVPLVIVTAANRDSTSDKAYIPIAGPWMEIAREPVSTGNKVALAISGAFQDLGALGLLLSIVVPERRTSQWYLIGNKRLSAAPAAGPHTYGLSARGQF